MGKFRTAWDRYRHLAALKGLLEGLGLWKLLVAGVGAVVGLIVGFWANLPIWARILLGLIACAITLFIAGFAIVLRRVYRDTQVTPAKDTEQLPAESTEVPVPKLNKWKLPKWVIVVGIIVVALIVIGIVVSRNRAPTSLDDQVYPPFRDLYERSKGLGKPGRIIKVKDGKVYEAAHESAMVVWTDEFSKVFVLSQGLSTGTEWNETYYSEPEFSTDDGTRKEFAKRGLRPPPRGKLPFAGVAKQWIANPTYWLAHVGGRLWHCSPQGAVIQRFENGWIVGGLVRQIGAIAAKQAVTIIQKGNGAVEYEVADLGIDYSNGCPVPPGTSN